MLIFILCGSYVHAKCYLYTLLLHIQYVGENVWAANCFVRVLEK